MYKSTIRYTVTGILSILFSCLELFAQNKLVKTNSLILTGINLSGSTLLRDTRYLSVKRAKETLEFEAGYKTILETEVVQWKNRLEQGLEARIWLKSIIKDLTDDGWVIYNLKWDSSYYRIERKGETLIMYVSNGKKKSDLYFGKANYTYTNLQNEADIIGSWGNLSSIQLISNSTIFLGNVDRSRSTNVGIEFKVDGTYFQTIQIRNSFSAITKVLYFKEAFGKYIIIGNHVTLIPDEINVSRESGIVNTAID